MGRRSACAWAVVAACACAGCSFDVRSWGTAPPIGVDDMSVPGQEPSDQALPPEPNGDLAGIPAGADLARIPDLANPACKHIDEDFGSDPAARWYYNGAASYDSAAKAVQLNPSGAVGSAGSAFYRDKLHMVAIDARFTFYMGDGGGADGMALVFAKANAVTDLVPFGDGTASQGYGLGYVGMNGFALELDSYKNSNNADPNDNHVGMVVTSNGTHFLTGVPSGPKMANGMQRHAHLRFDGKHITVEIDDKEVIDSDLPSTIIFNPDDYFIGFTGAGGGFPDRHRVHALSLVLGPPDVCF
jgi:hypothetical protein